MLACDLGIDWVRRTVLLRVILKRLGYPCYGLSDPTSRTGRLGQDRLSKGGSLGPQRALHHQISSKTGETPQPICCPLEPVEKFLQPLLIMVQQDDWN